MPLAISRALAQALAPAEGTACLPWFLPAWVVRWDAPGTIHKTTTAGIQEGAFSATLLPSRGPNIPTPLFSRQALKFCFSPKALG